MLQLFKYLLECAGVVIAGRFNYTANGWYFMRTIQIFLELIHSIESNPSVAPLLPWEDIQLCILTELECREGLYSSEQFRQILLALQELLDEAGQAASGGNADAVISRLQSLVFALRLLPETEYTDPLLEQANFDHACLRHIRDNTVIVLGDSHVNFFSGNEELSFIPIGNGVNTCKGDAPYPFTPLHIGPCLAYNCNRFQTTVSFREKVEYLCRDFIKPGARILCCLGEIDIRVHVWKQAGLQQKPYRDIVDEILAQYVSFLLRLRQQGYQVSCWGPIASQKENCPPDPKFPRNGTEVQRNMAAAYFNRQLSQLCGEQGIPFLSVFEHMITEDYLTLDEYLSPDHCHLGQRALTLALPEWQKLGIGEVCQ